MKLALVLLLPAALSACATPGRYSGQLSSYEGLEAKDGTVRTSVVRRSDKDRLAEVAQVSIQPARLAEGKTTAWLTPQERDFLLREVDAQLCFELTERFALAPPGETADAEVRAVVTRVAPTGRAASALSAASGFFIPGPIGLRVPGTVGGLGAEAEMIARDGKQVAAVVWNRNATPIGTDDPSLSRLGDALQFAEPFGDTVGAVMTPEDHKSRKIEDPDPCAQYGPRFRPEGFLAGMASGLYVPALSGAKAAPDDKDDDKDKAEKR
ncbi:MAG: DUF3313 domain-containing protein [Phenylobacterium sp.]|uniref:DUF3313 domain-containing protein n=1 Tax=Phenylobacterium sp. TaxID=1871053 RepID=UPI001A2C9C48|nr:DUF3313 domain-containing protein [Phenylobacterium sp.]MBJ7413552.1 DUF3313 domain-containing protein [Phenylobacterium sp.]